MGAWGTAIKDNDTFADIYGEFFELYDKGESPQDISNKLIADNQELIKESEDGSNFWFALALAQWETKSLDAKVFSTVEDIILTGKDVQSWRDLEADEEDIKKRKIVLDKFLEKLKTNKPKAKARKKPKNLKPIYSTGDCLTFKLKNGNHGGAVVLASDTNPEYANNLVATTIINQSKKPSVRDFEKSYALVCNFGNWKDEPKITWYYPEFYKKYSHLFELVGNIPVEKKYELHYTTGNNSLFRPSYAAAWDLMITTADNQLEHEKTNPKPNKSISIEDLTRKKKWWNIF